MSVFHNTVSRREFMKTLGLVGVGAAALTSPVFHDLDEMTTSDTADFKRPWYVKNLPLGQSTTDVDWSITQRFDPSLQGNSSPELLNPNYYTEAELPAVANQKIWEPAGKSGYDIRAFALANSCSINGQVNPWVWSGSHTDLASLGVPKYQGTPEANARMVRAALKYYGSSSMIGYTEMDTKYRAWIYLNDQCNSRAPAGATPGSHDQSKRVKKPLVFEGTTAQELPTKIVIPDVQMTMVIFAVPHSMQMFQTLPSKMGQGNEALVNSMITGVASRMERFFVELGYQEVSGDHDKLTSKPPFFGISGMCELSRDQGQSISWRFGMPFSAHAILTDLPIASTPGVDAGISRFCTTCKKCATYCPSQAITYDAEPSYNAPSDTAFSHQLGHKDWWSSAGKCKTYFTAINGCMTCMENCVFTKTNASMIHETVKGVISTTPVFSGFFRKMDEIFGYGDGPAFGIGPANNPLTGTFNPKGNEWFDLDFAPFGWDMTKNL